MIVYMVGSILSLAAESLSICIDHVIDKLPRHTRQLDAEVGKHGAGSSQGYCLTDCTTLTWIIE